MEKITIFTPSYNRAYKLSQLYNSLVRQTSKQFIWLIVDDGSTDNTENIIKQCIQENEIKIEYYKQENQGKMIAHNKGVEKCKTELFVCVDSDDYLKEETVETILETYKEIKDNEKCIGIVSNKIYENGQLVGTKLPSTIKYSTLYDLYEKYKYKGDTMLIFKTDIIKKYEFPKIDGEKFIPETYLYDKLDSEGKLYLLNEGLYVCEYLEDGYTKNIVSIIKNNPKGYVLCYKQRMCIAKGIKEKIKSASKYALGNILAKEKGYIKKSPKKIITIISIPLAYLIYIKRYK